MSDHDLDTTESEMIAAANLLYSKADAVVIVVSRFPNHDDAVGKVQFVRLGQGPAYALAIRTLISDIDLSEVEEIMPGEPDTDDDD